MKTKSSKGLSRLMPLAAGVIMLLTFASCETTDKLTAGMQKASDKITEKGQAISDKNRVKIDESREANKKAKEDITPEQEYYIGRDVAAKVLSNYKLYQNAKATAYVNEICTALTSASDMPDIYNGYHVGILDTKEINAISTPGGHILVTRGLLECAASEDELAAVIAHEVGHIQLKHAVKSIRTSRGNEATQSLFSAAGSILTGGSYQEGLGSAAGSLMTTLSTTGYSKTLEYEADVKAADLMAGAGYNPEALATMLEGLQEREKTQTAGMVKTHPSASSRLLQVRGHIRGLLRAEAKGTASFNEAKRTARFAAVKDAL
ncbi:MAG: M48 family metalloprotease [Treponema sp.]|nr:M48 family metalloprotease [Treponema sp.]